MEYEELDELGRGGMAVVYRARHKVTGDVVALKRPLPYLGVGCEERLAREITVMTLLDHPNVMPVLDHGTDEDGFSWYTMPCAWGNLARMWADGDLDGPSGQDVDAVADQILADIADGLAAMHAIGYVHRDVNPNNILAISDDGASDGYRWVVADCGIVRQPLGETTAALTGTATALGTPGYMAPETLGDPHGATTPAADVYSLGRVLAWLVTGTKPLYTAKLLPEGRWRGVVRLFTQDDPARRPQSMLQAISEADKLLEALPVPVAAQFRQRTKDLGDDVLATDSVWDVVADQVDDVEFMLDEFPLLTSKAVRTYTQAFPAEAAAIAEKLADHVTTGEWGRRGFDYANRHLDRLRAVLVGLLAAGHIGLFEDVAVGYIEAVKAWDRFTHNDAAGPWLRALDEPAGAAMTRAIRQAGVVEYVRDSLVGDRRCDSSSLEALMRQKRPTRP